MQLFITNLFSDNPADRFYFFAVVFVVVISIVLHELAHGWMALRKGDFTPQRKGRMTGNPLVHMGPYSLVALAATGIAWGQMPVDPTRLKGKYAEAMVSAAGPAVNLILAVVSLVTLGVLMRVWGLGDIPAYIPLSGQFDAAGITTLNVAQQNGLRLLAIAGVYNLVLMMFNLLPAAPLDGSHILANFNRRYARFANNPHHHGIHMLLFIGCFIIASQLMFEWSWQIMEIVVGWIA